MKQKTNVHAEEGKHDLVITRDFDLPVDLVFKAHSDPEIIEQWMDNKVLKFEAEKHGGWHYAKYDGSGNTLFEADGVFHEFVEDEKITRTFEMRNVPFGVQLEFLTFKKVTDESSRLTMHIVYKSNEVRDQVLKMPFAMGINMAHNRLEEIVSKLK